jgi:hypothetical protein
MKVVASNSMKSLRGETHKLAKTNSIVKTLHYPFQKQIKLIDLELPVYRAEMAP